MKYYLVVFLTVFLISVGILLLKNPFFLFANASANMLNSLLESKNRNADRSKLLIQSLGNLLPKFGLLLLFFAMTIGVSLIPVAVYLEYNPETTVRDLDKRSIFFFLSVVLGSLALITAPIVNRNREADSSGWSMLLHRMILENHNISRALFKLEKRWLRKKISQKENDFVIVSGLARGGGNVMFNLLMESGKFHSLSQENLPFLLSVNLSRKFRRSRQNKAKEKQKEPKVMFGYGMIETLEEFFFKVFLNNSYISPGRLLPHELDQLTYADYMSYQKMIGIKNRNSHYLTYSNNLILRYPSLRTHNPDFKIIIIFRSPVEQAYSLLKQHDRFCDMHEADPFTLEYMNWLGHHVFGLNHKVYDLELAYLTDRYKDSTINYWLAVWISYYSHVLSLTGDHNMFLLEYEDFCSNPEKVLSVLSERMNLSLPASHAEPYELEERPEHEVDVELLERSASVYEELLKRKIETD